MLQDVAYISGCVQTGVHDTLYVSISNLNLQNTVFVERFRQFFMSIVEQFFHERANTV